MPNQRSPEREIGFLLSDVSRLLRMDIDRRLRGLKLTQAQWRAIGHLAREEGVNQATLADRLEVKPITLARLIDRMEAAGWVTRTADVADKRASLLYLTKKVRPILDEMQAHATAALENLLSGISRVERAALLVALERMKENLVTAQSATGPESNAETKDHGGRKRESNRDGAG